MHFRDPERREESLDLAALSQDHPLRRDIRGGRISIIFQEPMSSLSPLHTIGDQISEAFTEDKTPFTWVPLPGSAKERSDVPSAGNNGLRAGSLNLARP